MIVTMHRVENLHRRQEVAGFVALVLRIAADHDVRFDLRTELRTEMADLRTEMRDQTAGQTRTLMLGLVGSVTALTVTQIVVAAIG